jgi:hypothetical protein
MQTRTKSAFLLLAVLVLGVAIGFLISGVLHNRRLDRIARIRTGPGIAQLVERVVRPESEEQRIRLREVMESAGPRFAEVFRHSQQEMEALSDSVMTELETILTPAQMEELSKHMQMRRGMPPGEWRERGRDGRRRPRDGSPAQPERRPPPPE